MNETNPRQAASSRLSRDASRRTRLAERVRTAFIVAALLSLPGLLLATAGPPTVSPISLDFPVTSVNSTSGQQSVTITASGGSVTVTGIDLTGANPGDFELPANNCVKAYTFNQTCQFYVQFSPTAEGNLTAAATVSYNTGIPGSLDVPLTGTGNAPPTISPASITFPNTGVHDTSGKQAVTITALAGAVTVDSIVLAGTNPDDFELVTNSCAQSYADQESCIFQVRFSPTAKGDRSAAVTVSYSSFVAGFQDVTLGGMANAPPSVPEIVYPKDGDTGIPTSLEFVWQDATDAENNDVTYTLFLCENADFTGCSGQAVSATQRAVGGPIVYGALGGAGLLLIGFLVPAARTRRGLLLLLLAGAISAAVIVTACSSGGGGGGGSKQPTAGAGETGHPVSGLASSTTYYWKVRAEDTAGGAAETAVYSFTTK